VEFRVKVDYLQVSLVMILLAKVFISLAPVRLLLIFFFLYRGESPTVLGEVCTRKNNHEKGKVSREEEVKKNGLFTWKRTKDVCIFVEARFCRGLSLDPYSSNKEHTNACEPLRND
jgi:hypothetical protein